MYLSIRSSLIVSVKVDGSWIPFVYLFYVNQSKFKTVGASNSIGLDKALEVKYFQQNIPSLSSE